MRAEAEFTRRCAAHAAHGDWSAVERAARAEARQRPHGRHHRRADRPHDARRRLAPAVASAAMIERLCLLIPALASGFETGAVHDTRRLRGHGGAVRQHHHLPRPVPAKPRSGRAARPAGAGPRQPALAGLGGADPARAPGQAGRQRSRRPRPAGPPGARPRRRGSWRTLCTPDAQGRYPRADAVAGLQCQRAAWHCRTTSACSYFTHTGETGQSLGA